MENGNELNNNLMSGNIKIIKSQIAFQRVAKDIINRKDVDPFTLGIYVKVLVLGEKWDLNVSGLARHLGITDAKVRRSFVLLENCGYIRRIHIKDEKTGRFTGWDYEIGEEPFQEADRSNLSKIQPLENPHVGKSNLWKIQPLENREGIIKDSTELEEQHTIPPTSPQGEKPKQPAFTPPTLQEVTDYALERGFADPAGFADFFLTICTNNGWRRAEGRGKPITNWKNYIVSCWERNRKNDVFSQQPQQKGATRIVPMDPSTFESLIP